MPKENTDDNIYAKIMKARLQFLESNPKKSGYNKFQDFKYYELDDIIPQSTRICNEIGLYTEIDLGANLFGYATLTVVNVDNVEEKVYFRIKMPQIEGNNLNNVLQDTGRTETYLRRYLYLLFLDIAQNDEVDASDNSPKKAPSTAPKKAPVNKPRSRPPSPSETVKKPTPKKTTQPMTTNKRLTLKQKKAMSEADETLKKIIDEGAITITMKQVLEQLQKMEEDGEISSDERLSIAKKISTLN